MSPNIENIQGHPVIATGNYIRMLYLKAKVPIHWIVFVDWFKGNTVIMAIYKNYGPLPILIC